MTTDRPIKRDRFASVSTRSAAVVLAVLLLAASLPAAGQIVFRFGTGGKKSAMATALATPAPSIVQTNSKRKHVFCCQFNESYCRHVDDEKDCR